MTHLNPRTGDPLTYFEDEPVTWPDHSRRDLLLLVVAVVVLVVVAVRR